MVNLQVLLFICTFLFIFLHLKIKYKIYPTIENLPQQMGKLIKVLALLDKGWVKDLLDCFFRHNKIA
ncbi:hypothetical protein SAMN04489864_108122 [Pedobacter insulae]|uniref:Uncharacterized protein n=1 Tax=Pedobacter insulae TaxID=414048 RepID=A0A1I2YVY0_9SPHI|nr:hypothetical protein SAMN04489864_108122 [Pedobacter insulae]